VTPDREAEAEPRVAVGSITVLRLYDVAYAIDLPRVESLCAASAPTERIRLARAQPKAIAFGVPPVEISLGATPLSTGDGDVTAEATARVYDFGAVSLALRVPVRDVSWTGLIDRVRRVDATLAAPSSDQWSSLLGRVRSLIGPAMERPSPAALEEDYLLTTVQRFDRDVAADEVLRDLDLPTLLAREEGPLSQPARRELIRQSFTYYTNDLVVLTWDHAFILEPSGESDVADVLEVANAQLLELRYYDELLDAELPRMYERVQGARAAFGGLARRRYANLARELYTLVAEVTEISERIENALIVTEDVYLARIYGTALELFRVSAWNAGVERKLAIIRDTYQGLFEEAATVRAEYLEAAIVLLIVLELVLAFVL
jgi:hypothetical protein